MAAAAAAAAAAARCGRGEIGNVPSASVWRDGLSGRSGVQPWRARKGRGVRRGEERRRNTRDLENAAFDIRK